MKGRAKDYSQQYPILLNEFSKKMLEVKNKRGLQFKEIDRKAKLYSLLSSYIARKIQLPSISLYVRLAKCFPEFRCFEDKIFYLSSDSNVDFDILEKVLIAIISLKKKKSAEKNIFYDEAIITVEDIVKYTNLDSLDVKCVLKNRYKLFGTDLQEVKTNFTGWVYHFLHRHRRKKLEEWEKELEIFIKLSYFYKYYEFPRDDIIKKVKDGIFEFFFQRKCEGKTPYGIGYANIIEGNIQFMLNTIFKKGFDDRYKKFGYADSKSQYKNVSHTLRKLRKPKPLDKYLEHFSKYINKESEDEIKQILVKIRQNVAFTGKKPQSLVAGAVEFVKMKHNKKIQEEKILKILQTSKVTARKIRRMIQKMEES